jgi:CopA family copper-resistance protein
MTNNEQFSRNGMPPVALSRRRFVQGVAAGGLLAGLGLPTRPARASEFGTGGEVLKGTNIDLSIAPLGVNFTGAPATAIAVNGQVPAPVLHLREGDEVRLRVKNATPDLAAIHWHGLLLPATQDGVPGISFAGIKPGETHTYAFKLRQHGTYWYHSHAGFHEPKGVYGALIVEPREGPTIRADRDYVVVLSDWSDEEPAAIFDNLKKQSDYYNFSQRTFFDFTKDVAEKGLGATLDDRLMWGAMNMTPTDIADVTAYTYTYLMNGKAPAEGWSALFRPGERIRLRFINASSMTYFDVRIPGLKMKVVAADGNDVEPVSVDEFRMGVAETYDVIVEPEDDRPYAVFAQSMDRSGYAFGTLAPRAGMRAKVPAMDPRPMLTMADMGGMAGMSGMSGMQDMSGVTEASPMGGNNAGMAGMSHAGGMHGMDASGGKVMPAAAMIEVTHPASEDGPGAVMQPSSVSLTYSDPGPGLRKKGRRVLTYADLRGVNKVPVTRDPDREIELHLTGNMERYMWSFNGVKFSDADPIHMRYGERVRVRLVNDTMMAHPIHLHGMWSEIDNGQGDHRPLKHTVNVNPGHAIDYFVNADAPGGWAYHCHLVFHMDAGMFRKVSVS